MSDEPDLRIVRGNPTPEELAAVIALVSEAYSGEVADAVAEDKTPSAWHQSRRGMRTPLRRDIPWGKFSG